ncbi:oligoendopeptidase F [Longimonas halophila]|uniref:Oligoendopeptidase F n=1 Tax=Longimonas halophila TaxID=1469170 RepID=A0A2H3P986_9BACT|nr:M3 family oligoendopeptidase [Longimonas halophila]PEN09475.1 oligoendopeptidase F [Longimonas halophila]
MAQRTNSANTVQWELGDLYATPDALRADMEALQADAEAFADAHRGQIADCEAPALAELLDTYETLLDRAGRAHAYAFLRWATNTGDEKRGALLQHVREQYAQLQQQLLFVEVEWTRVDDERVAQLLEHDALAPYTHYLEVEHARADHVLTEREEQVLSEKNVTGHSAWTRFFDETLGDQRYTVDGEALSQQEILSNLYEPDRDTRRTAALAFTDGLTELQRPLTFVFNTVLADKASTDRLRDYDHWLQSRNESNQVEHEMVEALIDAVTGRYDLAGRFYRLKKKLLGLDTLYDYDRYAPIQEATTTYEWDRARSLVLDAYGTFHPRMADVARRFFKENWIDAALSEGKRSGAFSHSTVPSAHPYVLLNYTERARDVQTLAHELGHGVHQYLARGQGALQQSTPLTTAETASVFGEMLVFQELMQTQDTPEDELALLISKIDDTMATVFRQVAMNRFEDRIHTHRRTEGELSADDFSAHWMETQRAMFDGSVTLGDHYRHWWSYIPHFLHTPGYVYAYAFGELLVLALHARYQDAPDGFADRYLSVLEAGGSEWPHRLMERMGVDLTNPAFWEEGLREIEALIDRAESLAESASTPAHAG